MLYLCEFRTKQGRIRYNKRHNNNIRPIQQTVQIKKNLKPTNPPNPNPIIKSLYPM